MPQKEKNWSAIGMEEDGGLRRTMECLRGRLVAERQCSRAAKESADELCIKLKELEKKLKEETKMRDRAEKKLRLLKRKMESVKVGVRSEDAEQHPSSSVSENSLVSCESSVTTVVARSSSTKHPQEQEANSCIRKGVMLVNSEDNNAPETAQLKQGDDSSSSGDDRHSIVTEISSEACHEKIGPDLEVFKPDDHRKLSEEETDSGVDNSLAIVAVNNVAPDSEASQTGELKIVNRSVSEVLEVLRLAREGIQRRMEQKHMIKLGPAQARVC